MTQQGRERVKGPMSARALTGVVALQLSPAFSEYYFMRHVTLHNSTTFIHVEDQCSIKPDHFYKCFNFNACKAMSNRN
jgi:hypothetical protein